MWVFWTFLFSFLISASNASVTKKMVVFWWIGHCILHFRPFCSFLPIDLTPCEWNQMKKILHRYICSKFLFDVVYGKIFMRMHHTCVENSFLFSYPFPVSVEKFFNSCHLQIFALVWFGFIVYNFWHWDGLLHEREIIEQGINWNSKCTVCPRSSDNARFSYFLRAKISEEKNIRKWWFL